MNAPVPHPVSVALIQALDDLDAPTIRAWMAVHAHAGLQEAEAAAAARGGLVNIALNASRAHYEARVIQTYPHAMSEEKRHQVLVEILADVRQKTTAAIQALVRAHTPLPLNNRLKGYPPIVLAASLGLGKVLSHLVRHGADPAATTTLGKTALHLAAHHAQHGCLQRLAGMGVALDVQDQDRRTAAHLAARQHNLRALRELKRWGARFDLTDQRGLTPVDELAQHGEALRGQWLSWERGHETQAHARRLSKHWGPSEPRPAASQRKPRL